MPQIYFTKMSEHTAQINNVPVILWRIKLIGEFVQAGKIFYVRASKVHAKLDKTYWTDSKFLISEDKVSLPRTINVSEKEDRMSYPGDPRLFQQIECGSCSRVNLVSIDPAVQGAHYCTQCRGTICIITGKQLVLKHGSIALNTVKEQRK